MHIPKLLSALLFCALLAGCQAAMYRALESVGIEKRDILVDRVGDARDSQTAAKEQFASALDRFRSVVQSEGTDLERVYDQVQSDYDKSRDRAQAVHDRIDAVESVAEDLFREWEKELDQYSNASLRRDSVRLLHDTRTRYTSLIRRMRLAEDKMQPVLEVFEDSALTLKHNLNAQAIRSLRTELSSIEKQTASLITEMNRSIDEANAFIDRMRARDAS
jgi:hypothetical protein